MALGASPLENKTRRREAFVLRIPGRNLTEFTHIMERRASPPVPIPFLCRSPDRAFPSTVFEVLDGLLMLNRGAPGAEGSKVPSFPRFGIFLPRIQTIPATLQFSNHPESLATSSFRCKSSHSRLRIGTARATRLLNDCRRNYSLAAITSIFSIAGGFASKSGAFAINAAATLPERCA